MQIGLVAGVFVGLSAIAALAQDRGVFLEDATGTRIRIGTLNITADSYSVEMAQTPFSDHFLSMRPFRCLEGPTKHWCHVPYPYPLDRISPTLDTTDLEYDLLFLWKGSTEYGINMWNGVYYQLEPVGSGWVGVMHDMDMDLLSAPPPADIRHPIRDMDLERAEPESHWLPRLIIE